MTKEEKALKTLARNVESLEIDTFYECKGAYQTLETALTEAEEYKKVLEVVFKKGIDTTRIRYSNNLNEYYGEGYENFIVNPLTQEEFELLKKWAEVLK